MNRVPSEYGGSFYRDKLTEQGKYFYDCLVSHFARGNFSSAVNVKIHKCDTAFSDGFAAYKAVRDDKPELFFLGNQCEFVWCGSKGTIKCTILYSDVLTLSFMYRLIRKNNDNFKRSLNFYNKL